MGTVIGLDVATRTGIAVGEPNSKPLCWSERLGDADSGHDERFAQAMQMTARLIRKHDPILIALEMPIKARHDKLATNILLMGLVACIRGIAHAKHIPTRMVNIRELDVHFIERAGRKSKDRKLAIMSRCKQLGWAVPDQDAADAAAVWSFACSTLSRSHGIATTPLFQP